MKRQSEFFSMSRRLVAIAALVGLAYGTNASAGQKPSRTITIVAVGDSLTAGFNLPPDASFPAQLQVALRARGHKVTIANSGVSGDTTAAGLARLDWAVPADAHAAIVELGANDALRGIDPAEARANLEKIVRRLRKRGMPVLLAGMRAPGNWGSAYAKRFDAMFGEIASATGAQLYPFFLDGVALRADLNLADGIHPNAKGVAEIVKRIVPYVERLLADIPKPKG